MELLLTSTRDDGLTPLGVLVQISNDEVKKEITKVLLEQIQKLSGSEEFKKIDNLLIQLEEIGEKQHWIGMNKKLINALQDKIKLTDKDILQAHAANVIHKNVVDKDKINQLPLPETLKSYVKSVKESKKPSGPKSFSR